MAMWELAPGSPWNAIFMVLIGLVMAPCISRSGFGQYPARGFEVGRSVDAARHGVDNSDVDPHAGLERPQLFQLLLLFQRRGGEADEALQRQAAIGVEPDVMVARPVAMGRGGSGEIKCAQPPGADHRAD